MLRHLDTAGRVQQPVCGGPRLHISVTVTISIQTAVCHTAASYATVTPLPSTVDVETAQPTVLPPIRTIECVWKRCCDPFVCLCVPFFDSLSFVRWRYTSVAVSHAFDRTDGGQHGRLCNETRITRCRHANHDGESPSLYCHQVSPLTFDLWINKCRRHVMRFGLTAHVKPFCI